VYEHYYKNTTSGEIASEINSYTGKTIDLGGSRPGKSRRVRGRQAGEEYEYMGSRFTKYTGTDAKGLAELEKKILQANKDADYKILNKNDVHPENF